MLLLLVGCGGGTSSSEVGPRVETVVSGLAIPWGVAPLPDGRVLVTERAGGIVAIRNGVATPYATVPGEAVDKMLDLLRDPRDGTLLVSFSTRAEGGTGLAVSRARDTGTGLAEWTRLLTLPPRSFGDHFGGRLALAVDGGLLLSTGERRETALARNPASPWGKILRLDGVGGYTVLSRGHRNPLGLTFAPDGALWSTENGPSGYDAPGGGDEVNRIEAGADYGWPTIHHDMVAEGLRSPAWQSGVEAVAPGGAAIPQAGRWAGRLVVPCLRGRRLIVFDISGAGPRVVEELSVGGSRLRTAVALDDGSLLVSTSDSEGAARVDRLVRVTP